MFNFLRFAQERNIPIIEGGHHHSHQGWIQTHCPFCTNGTHGWHLGFSLQKGNFNCWRCGGHSVWKVVGTFLHTNQKDLISRVLRDYSTDPKPLVPQRKARRRTLKPPPGMGPLGRPHLRYLEKRGFTPGDLVEEWGLEGTQHLSGPWSWRVVAPVKDRENHIVAYVGRSILQNGKPKYKMTDEEDILVDPKTLLYGIEKVQKKVLVVEGPADVWRMGPGAVALLGIDWKREQAAILRDIPERYIMLDPESLAQRRARRLAEWLGIFPGITEILTDLSTDPGGLSPQRALGIRKVLGFS